VPVGAQAREVIVVQKADPTSGEDDRGLAIARLRPPGTDGDRSADALLPRSSTIAGSVVRW
jgi:hypothetical protein